MTGFGRAECQENDYTYHAEIRSVNNRFIEINTRLPKAYSDLEQPLKKLIKSIGEKCKVSIRNIRRDANDELKKLLKDKDIGEDEEKSSEKNVQTITDNHIKSVDEKVSLKEKEIMTI